MLLIKNGTIYAPKERTMKKADLLIVDGKIQKIEEQIALDELKDMDELEVVDAAGKQIGPGLIDVHVHFRDPGFTYKEDIMTGSKAAMKGGFTTVVLMANTKPCVDNEETLLYIIEKGKETGIHVETCATITKGLAGKEVVDMENLFAKGAVGFTDDGVPILDEELLREAMKKAAKLNLPISLHEENPEFITNNGVNRGIASDSLEIGGSDRQAEISMVARDIEVALETNAILNVQHISTLEAVEMVRKAKKKGTNIHAEATPHHFSLTEEAVLRFGTLAKMNPPLRTEADKEAIIEGLKDGTIDVIATDHAPHSQEEKEKKITDAPSGIIGLETAFSLAITNLVRTNRLTLLEVLDRMSYGPAKLYGFKRGAVCVGEVADLIIFDEKETVTYDSFVSKSQNSPFQGETMYGKILYTVCDGNIVYRA